MDAKSNCKSSDKFTLKYYSLSIATWGSPEIAADGEQNMQTNHYMFAFALYSHLQILCWPLTGRLLNQKNLQPGIVTVKLAFQSTDRRS